MSGDFAAGHGGGGGGVEDAGVSIFMDGNVAVTSQSLSAALI